MRRFVTIIAGILTCWMTASGFSVTGTVVDENGARVPYANIYVKELPQNGTISDGQGVFTINEVAKNQNVVISFVGFKTVELKIRREPKDTLRIKLVEQPVLLQEAQVGKEKKQSHRKQMKKVLSDVRAQMAKDFPDGVNVRYNVNSDYGVYNGSTAIAIEDLGGNIVECPGAGKDGKDLIQLKIDWITRYRDAHTQKNYLRLDSTLKKKTNSKLVHYADSSRWVHRFLWGGSIKYSFDHFAEHPTRWQLEERDSVAVLTYTETRNYIGIAKGKLVLTFYLNPYSYSILKQSQDLTVDLNIPFGYKLNKEQIQMLNTLVLGGVQFEKYRVKRAHIDIQRNILYTSYPDAKLGVREKNILTNIRIEDRRRRKPVYFRQTGSIKVNGATFGVVPYSRADEMAQYKLVLKPKP